MAGPTKKDASKQRPARNPRSQAPPPQNPDTFMLDPNWKGPLTAGQAMRKAAWESLRPYDESHSPIAAERMAAQAAAVNSSIPGTDAELAAYDAGRTYSNPPISGDVVDRIRKTPPKPLLIPPAVAAQQAQRKRRNDMALHRDITQQQSVPTTSLRSVLWGQ